MKLPLMVAAVALSALMPAADAANLQERGDPLNSARWNEMHRAFLAGLPYVFDPRVRKNLGFVEFGGEIVGAALVGVQLHHQAAVGVAHVLRRGGGR